MTHPRGRRLTRQLVAITAAVVLLAGCGGGVPSPGPSNVDVDTPELQQQKAAAGIAPCVPGDGEGDLPDLTLPCLGGGPEVDLSTLQGPMLLNLWYSGCAPCRREMPVLQQLHERYADQIAVVGLDIETYPGSAIGFADEVGATYPQLADPGGQIFDNVDLLPKPAFPTTILLDADGRVAFVKPVELTSLEQVVDLVDTELGLALVNPA